MPFTFQAQPGAPAVAALGAPSWIAQRVVQVNAAKIGLMTAYRVDHEGIHIVAGFDEAFYAWSQVAAVEEWKGQFAVFTGPRFASVPNRRLTFQISRRILSVPTGGLSEQQRTELRALLQSRGATVVPAAAD